MGCGVGRYRRCGDGLVETLGDGRLLRSQWIRYPYSTSFMDLLHASTTDQDAAFALSILRSKLLSALEQQQLQQQLWLEDQRHEEEVYVADEVMSAVEDRQAAEALVEWETSVVACEIDDSQQPEELSPVIGEQLRQFLKGAVDFYHEVPAMSLQPPEGIDLCGGQEQGRVIFENPASHGKQTPTDQTQFVTHSSSSVPLVHTTPAEPDVVREGTLGFPTARRVVRRPLDIETTMFDVDEWFQRSGITIGSCAETEDQQEAAKRLCYTYRDLFAQDLSDIQQTDLVQHSIPLKPGVTPYAAKTPLFTREEEEYMALQIPKLEQAGIIGRCSSPWASRCKFVRKKDGKLRWVNVFCPLNKATLKEPYPVPRLESVVNDICRPDHQIYCSLDGSNGYWGIPMKPTDATKTAFNTPLGQFCWLRMGQGLMGAVFTYSRFGDVAFGSIPAPSPEPRLESDVSLGVLFRKFMDDNYFSGKTFWQVFEFLAFHYFPRCAWAKVTLSGSKAFIFMPQIDVMGFQASAAGLRPDDRKVKVFAEYPQPQNQAELERFLYLTPFLRWFIPGRAEHAKILKTAIVNLRSPAPGGGRSIIDPHSPLSLQWTPECTASFLHIKNSVLRNAVSSGDPTRQYHLATDASLTGAGGVLFQILDTPPGTKSSAKTHQKERLVMFMSRSFSAAESRYSTTDREALACLLALEEARPLILGSPHPTFLYTDHQALVSMLGSDDTRGRIARWQNRFAEYDLVVIHVPGKSLAIADGLSRFPAHSQLRTFDPVADEHCVSMFETSGSPFSSISHALAIFAWETYQASLPLQTPPSLMVEDMEVAGYIRHCRACGMAFGSGTQLHKHLKAEPSHQVPSLLPDDVPRRPASTDPAVSCLRRFRKKRGARRLAKSNYETGLFDAMAAWNVRAMDQLQDVCMSFVMAGDLASEKDTDSDAASLSDVSMQEVVGLEHTLGDFVEGEPLDVTLVRTWLPWLRDSFYGPVVQFKLFGRVGDILKTKDWDNRRRRQVRKMAMRFRMVEQKGGDSDGEAENGKGEKSGLSLGSRGKPRLYYVEANGSWSRCLRQEEVSVAMKELHDKHGHFAWRITLAAAFGKFYWPTRSKDVHEYCASCVECQKDGPKIPGKVVRPICQLAPWDMIGMDWLTVSPSSSNGHAYVHLVVDYFSRYVFLETFATHRSDDTVKHLERLFRTVGVPRKVYSDNGPHFAQGKTPAFLVAEGADQKTSPIYHPASVGLSERFVRMVRSVLRKLSALDPRGPFFWHEYIRQVEWTINNRVMRVHGYTPSQLFLGRETLCPALTYQVMNDFMDSLKDVDFSELSALLDENQLHSHTIMLEDKREASVTSVIAHQESQVSTGRGQSFEAGDLVLVRNVANDNMVGRKMEKKWLGPFVVSRVHHHKASVELKELSGKKRGRHSVNTLKMWVRRPDRWVGGKPEVFNEW